MIRSLIILFLELYVLGFSHGQELNLIQKNHISFVCELDHNLWIPSATAGFNRYNGILTEHYSLNDSLSGLEGTVIQSKLFKDNDGLYWTSTYEKMCMFDPSLNVFDCFALEYRGNQIESGYHIFHDIDEFIYLRGEDSIFVFDIKQMAIVDELGQTNGNRLLYHDDIIIGSPWITDIGIEVWTNNAEGWVKESVKFDQCYASIHNLQFKQAIFTNGEYWLLSSNGLLKFDLIDYCNSTLYTYQNKKTDLIFGAVWNHYLLLSSETDGILIFDLESEKFGRSINNLSDHIPLRSNSPYEIFVDSKKNIWVSYVKNGIHKISSQDLDAYIKRIDPSNRDNWSVLNAHHGSIIYSDGNSKLEIIDLDQNLKHKSLQSLGAFDNILKVEHLSNDEVILLDNLKLASYNLGNDSVKFIDTGLNKQFHDVTIVDDSIYILSGFSVYASEIDIIDFKEVYAHKYRNEVQRFGYLSTSLKSFICSSSDYWITSPNLDTTVQLSSYINKATYDPSTQTHYVATNAGLFSIDKQYNVQHIKPDIGELGTQPIYDVKYYEGDVYMSVGDRIAQYDIEDEALIYFTQVTFDGTPVFDIHDSTLYIGNKYVSSYSLEEAFVVESDMDIALEAIYIHDSLWRHDKIDFRNELKLDYTQNNLAIMHCLNDWHSAAQSSIRYKIDPISTDWTIAPNCDRVQLPLLLPGDYTYNVQGILPSSNRTDIQSIKIHISPPWWKSTWFYALGLIGFLTLVYALYRYRVSQIQRSLAIADEINQLEKSALQAQMNPHFIFNCLNSIQGFIMENDKEKAMEYLGKFAKLIRLTLNSSVDSHITLDQEMLLLENYLQLEHLRANHSFSYDIQCDPSIDADQVQLPPMLIQPFVENAVIHGMKSRKTDGHISIQIEQDNGSLTVAIIDNGISDTSQKHSKPHRSLGMDITKKRLEHINNESSSLYNIQHVPTAEGTHIQVKIKIKSLIS